MRCVAVVYTGLDQRYCLLVSSPRRALVEGVHVVEPIMIIASYARYRAWVATCKYQPTVNNNTKRFQLVRRMQTDASNNDAASLLSWTDTFQLSNRTGTIQLTRNGGITSQANWEHVCVRACVCAEFYIGAKSFSTVTTYIIILNLNVFLMLRSTVSGRLASLLTVRLLNKIFFKISILIL